MHTFNISIKKNKLFANSAKTKQHSRWTNSTTLCKKIYSKRKKSGKKGNNTENVVYLCNCSPFSLFMCTLYTLCALCIREARTIGEKKNPQTPKTKFFSRLFLRQIFLWVSFRRFARFICALPLFFPFFINHFS